MTYKNPSFPDAGWDPIASHAIPFMGDFVIDGSTTPASGSLYSKEIYTVLLHPGDNKVDWRSPASAISAYSNFFIKGYERVSGDISGNSNLYITGNETVTGFSHIFGDISGDSNLYITGNETVGGFSHIIGDISGNSNIYITGNGNITGFAHIVGDVSGDSNLYITGNETVGGFSHIIGDISGDSNIYIAGNENVTGFAHIVGDVSGDSNVYITGNETVGGFVSISGQNSSGDGLVVNENAYVNGELHVHGESEFDDKVSIDDNGLFVTGDSRFENDLVISGDVSAHGHIETDSYLYANGYDASGYGMIVEENAKFKGNVVEIDGILSAASAYIEKIDIKVGEKDGYILSGGLTGTDKTKIPANYDYVAGRHNLYLSGEGLASDSWADIYGETQLHDDLTVFGDISGKATLQLDGAATFGGGVTVTGNMSLKDGTVSIVSDDGSSSTEFSSEQIFISDATDGSRMLTWPTESGKLALQGDVDLKADKVVSAVSGNFAALDGEGNLMDSGKNSSDFVDYADPRLYDERPPTNHANSHKIGGDDEISPYEIGAINSSAIADEFVEDFPYSSGDYVTHEGSLYKCTSTSGVQGEWDVRDWDSVQIVDELGSGGGGGGGISAVKKSNGTEITPDANRAVTLPSHKVWAATATYTNTGSTTRYAVAPFGDDFALEEGCVVVFKAPAENTGTTTELNVGGTGNKTLCRWTAQGWQTVPANVVSSGAIVVAQYTLGLSYAGTNKWVLLGWEKANLKSPEFTGTPTAPTANAGTNTTQIANTAFVQSAVSGKLASAERNLLAYASTTTLAPETAAYRSSLNADGTFPTIDDTAIPTASSYFRFELEMKVPDTVPASIPGPTGWVWLSGHELPNVSDLTGGETIFIDVRLDCTTKTYISSVIGIAQLS